MSSVSTTRDPAPGWSFILMAALTAVYAAVFSWLGPLATNDGPIHVGFAHFLSSAHELPALGNYYEINPRFTPNSLIYYLLRFLFAFLTPSAAETILQLGYLLGFVSAFYVLCRQVNPHNNGAIAVFAFPLALSQAFFLGLYNHAYSTVGFLVFLGCFLRLQSAPGWRRAGIAALVLGLTLLAHASGFIAACVAIAVLLTMQVVPGIVGRTPLKTLVREHRHQLAVAAFGLLLSAAMLKGSTRSVTEFGPSVLDRLPSIAAAWGLFLGHGKGNGTLVLAIGAFLSAAAPLLTAYLVRRAGRIPAAERAMALRILALWAAMLVLALSFPDVMGGGWTHFRRMSAFPLYLALLCYACLPLPPVSQKGLAAFGAAVSAVLLFMMWNVQRQAGVDRQELDKIDRLIGAHCTVLPLVTWPYPTGAVPDRRPAYDPFYQVASYLELNKDRPVLFNYLARLSVYPVKARPGKDAQDLLFHWKPEQRDTAIKVVDIPRFEAATGMHVDYVLQWGRLDAAFSKLRQQIKAAEAGATLVYRSENANISLYRRPPAAPRDNLPVCAS